MDGYKADFADGVFTDADQKYLRALHKRLSGKGSGGPQTSGVCSCRSAFNPFHPWIEHGS
jgi:hypothetical protein